MGTRQPQTQTRCQPHQVGQLTCQRVLGLQQVTRRTRKRLRVSSGQGSPISQVPHLLRRLQRLGDPLPNQIIGATSGKISQTASNLRPSQTTCESPGTTHVHQGVQRHIPDKPDHPVSPDVVFQHPQPQRRTCPRSKRRQGNQPGTNPLAFVVNQITEPVMGRGLIPPLRRGELALPDTSPHHVLCEINALLDGRHHHAAAKIQPL